MGPATVCGLAIETDDKTGRAVKIAGLRLGGVLTPTEPQFWIEGETSKS
jgi:calcineurin-like phosphoesterase